MMASVITDLARQYRARAEETRVRAETSSNAETRKSLQVAETWDRMARYEEQHHPQRNHWKIRDDEAPQTPPKPYA
jgi:hypothetical protein